MNASSFNHQFNLHSRQIPPLSPGLLFSHDSQASLARAHRMFGRDQELAGGEGGDEDDAAVRLER